MLTRMLSCAAVLLLASPVLAQGKAPAPAAPAAPAKAAPAVPAAPTAAPDMTKMGPMSRPVTKEKEDRKAIDEAVKAFTEAAKKGDVNAAADLVDFPVTMITDDSKGALKMEQMTREQWIAAMKPMFVPPPKDLKMTSKHDVVLLSDDLAYLIGDDSVTMGKVKGRWRSVSLLTKKDGKWKMKSMAEAGWGDAMSAAGKPGAPGKPAK